MLAYTDALVLDGGRVADGVFDVLREHLSDEEILELTYITALYDMHAVMSRALRTEFDDVPEAMAEVPAPADPPSGVSVGPNPDLSEQATQEPPVVAAQPPGGAARQTRPGWRSLSEQATQEPPELTIRTARTAGRRASRP